MEHGYLAHLAEFARQTYTEDAREQYLLLRSMVKPNDIPNYFTWDVKKQASCLSDNTIPYVNVIFEIQAKGP